MFGMVETTLQPFVGLVGLVGAVANRAGVHCLEEAGNTIQ
jgi:hypothetical protein